MAKAYNHPITGLVYSVNEVGLVDVRDPKTGACGSVVNLFAEPRLNHHTEVQGGMLAEECGTMLSAFFAERRQQTRTA